MTEYISPRRSAGATNLDPLFVTTNGTVLCRSVFISKLRIVLSSLRFDATKYQIHSIRIGSAASAAYANIPDHLIKTLGRWSSKCYARYILADEDLVRNAQIRMLQL